MCNTVSCVRCNPGSETVDFIITGGALDLLCDLEFSYLDCFSREVMHSISVIM
jgi:hypothetical protein